MTRARSDIVSSRVPGFYHCYARCVRQAWLFGTDPRTGRCYSHRKLWVESRMFELDALFGVELWAYAVMRNHYHLVLYLDPNAPWRWSAEEVVRRWLRLCPNAGDPSALVGDALKVEVFRRRLGSLSWFMRFLNEDIARRANREDECRGRFWEGRFRAQPLLNRRAALACMTYADLNPCRASAALRPEAAEHTSFVRRARHPDIHVPDQVISPVVSGTTSPGFEEESLESARYLAITEAVYMQWVERLGAIHREPNGPRSFDAATEPILRDVVKYMREMLQGRLAYGDVDALRDFAVALGQRWIRGVRTAPPS